MTKKTEIVINRCICNEIGNGLCPVHFPEQSNYVFRPDNPVNVTANIKSVSEIRQKINELQTEFETRDRSGDSHCQSKPLMLLQSIKTLKWVLNEGEL